MLPQLRIKNFAIVDEAELEFAAGLNIITGETGAGKSILIKALTTLAGGKTSLDLIRSGADQAVVTGLFEVPFEHPVISILSDLGLEPQASEGSKQQIILRRTVNQKGRSVCYVNDCPTSLQSLIKVSTQLLDILGQHENQRLLNPVEHYRYLDLFLSDRKHLERYRNAFEQVSALTSDFKAFFRENLVRQRDRDYLLFRLKELDELSPSESDFAELEVNIARQSQLQGWRNAISRSREMVDEAVNGESLGRAMELIIKDLSTASAAHESVPSIIELAESIRLLTDDLSYRVNQVFARLDEEDGDHQVSQERLDRYYDLMHKTSSRTISELVAHWIKLQDEVRLSESAGEHLSQLLADLRLRLDELKAAGKFLSSARKKAADKLQKAVQAELADLGIPDARFVTEFSRSVRTLDWGDALLEQFPELNVLSAGLCLYSSQGAECVQFLLGANVGEACLPLEKAASGGEISRIMLAIKKAMAVDAGTCVMVFDEIDTGISGRIADRVGRKLSELSQLFQVVCISHLPQVAVYADVNMSVRKSTADQRTVSQIVRLSKSNELIDEIAKLLSGPELSVSSRKNAKDLIAKATESKRV